MKLRGLAYLVGLLLLVGVGGALGFWGYARLVLGIRLQDQPTLVRFPPVMPVEAMARNNVKIGLNGYIQAEVPFKQELKLPLYGEYTANIKLDTTVSIQFTINYRGAIPVDTMATIRGVTDFNYEKVKRLRNVAFTAEIPLRFEQPIALVVPVKADLRLVYSGPLTVVFDQTVSAPVDTTLHTSLKAVRDITTPILARFGLRVQWPQEPLPVIIQRADLGMKISTLRLEPPASTTAEGD